MLQKIFVIVFILAYNSLSFSQPRYVTTIHPFKEILHSVVEGRGTVHEIIPPGASPHTYEMRPSDMRKVEGATALIFGAPNLDGWAVKLQSNHSIKFVELIPASYRIHFKGHSHHHGDEHGAGHESDIDPHFWTDPLTVRALLPNLVQKLISIDPEGADIYQKNAHHFGAHLDSLHLKIEKILAPVKTRTIMLSHPFFQYYCQRYNFTIVDIIEKSPGKEPTPREVKKLIDRVKTDNVSALCTHPQLPDRAAKLVAESTNTGLVELDPLGGVKNRQSYDDILLYNTHKLTEALK
jgi:zinc transport system substrate-binding protein